MRNILSVLVAGLLLTSAAARAQQILPPTGGDGTVDIGIRFSDLTGDDYRLQRFRDLSDGMLVDRFRMDQRGQRWWFSAGADHLGRDDQRLFGDFRVDRKLKISFVWDEVPLNYSGDTRTLYMVQSPGTLRLVDSLQGGIEGGRFTLADVVGQAVPFAVSSYRHVAAVDLVYNATRELRLKARVMRTDRKGTMPYIGSFGFSDAVELAAPIDTRTTDVEAGLEWNNPYAALRVGYNGSTFDNHVPTLVWDNPLKLTDSTASNNYSNGLGTSQGRAALPPSNTMHGITTAGSFRLPGNTRISATVTAGAWNQNEVLLPITINTAVPAAPLPRETAEAEARTLAMTYGLTSRPNQYLWFNARYRYYDYNNRTPEFTTPFDVVFDQVAHPEETTEPLGRKREDFDLEASISPVGFVALRAGYTLGKTDRTFRIFAHTEEKVYRASVDTFAKGVFTVRWLYEHGERRGSVFEGHLLEDVGERPEMRHFDVADRDRDHVTALVQVAPHKSVSLSASYTLGRDDYVNSGMGLRNNENTSYSVSAELTPGKKVAAAVYYTNEEYTALQNARNISIPGSGQLTDPTRDWATDSDDRVEIVGASVELFQAVPRTDIRLAYDNSRSDASYVYRVPSNSTLAALRQLPPVRNETTTVSGDVRVTLTKQLAVGVMYWYEDYFVDDFGFSPTTLNALNLPGSLFLGYVYRPYTASTGVVRLICTW